MREYTRRTLTAIAEKAHKLKSFKFDEHVRSVGLGWRTTRVENGWFVEFDLPKEEKRDAFLLTFRMFIQQNEPISFHKLNKIINDPEVSEELKSGLRKARQSYIKYIDGYPENIQDIWGERPTRGEILKVVLYGDLAHTKDVALRHKYEDWTRDEIRKSVLLQAFTRTIVNILELIDFIAELSEQELKSGF